MAKVADRDESRVPSAGSPTSSRRRPAHALPPDHAALSTRAFEREVVREQHPLSGLFGDLLDLRCSFEGACQLAECDSPGPTRLRTSAVSSSPSSRTRTSKLAADVALDLVREPTARQH